MNNKFILKINTFLNSISDRAIATIAVFFPVAYLLEFILSRLQNEEISIKSVFVFWLALIVLRFPILYNLSLLMAALSFTFTGLIQVLKTDRFVDIGPMAGFGFLILAIIQIYLFRWQAHEKR